MDRAIANERLEQTQWDLFWLPPDAGVIDRPELLVIHCRKPISYLNTVVRTRAPAERLPALIAEAAAAHAHTTSRWLVADTIDTRALERELVRAGYEPSFPCEARAVHTASFQPRPHAVMTVRMVDSLERLRDCTQIADAAFGSAVPRSEESLRFELSQCIAPDRRVHRFVAYDQRGAAVSSGGLSVFPELRFGLLWAGGTVIGARGRGAYSALVAARIRKARELGLEYVGLYAKVDSSAPIVARQGFVDCGRMTYWERPATS